MFYRHPHVFCTGWGLLTFVLWWAPIVVAIHIYPFVGGGRNAWLISYSVAAVLNLIVGAWSNWGQQGHIAREPKLGTKIAVSRPSTLYGIRMEYWSIFLILIGSFGVLVKVE